jgi:hypothetical protein
MSFGNPQGMQRSVAATRKEGLPPMSRKVYTRRPSVGRWKYRRVVSDASEFSRIRDPVFPNPARYRLGVGVWGNPPA